MCLYGVKHMRVPGKVLKRTSWSLGRWRARAPSALKGYAASIPLLIADLHARAHSACWPALCPAKRRLVYAPATTTTARRCCLAADPSRWRHADQDEARILESER